MIGYVPTSSPAFLDNVYSTVSFPRVPATFAVNSGSVSPNTFDLLSAVTVTLLGVIVNFASAVNSTPLTVAFASIVYTPASLKLGIAPHSFTSLPSCFKRY